LGESGRHGLAVDDATVGQCGGVVDELDGVELDAVASEVEADGVVAGLQVPGCGVDDGWGGGVDLVSVEAVEGLGVVDGEGAECEAGGRSDEGDEGAVVYRYPEGAFGGGGGEQSRVDAVLAGGFDGGAELDVTVAGAAPVSAGAAYDTDRLAGGCGFGAVGLEASGDGGLVGVWWVGCRASRG